MKIYIIPYPDKGFNYFWCCPRGTEIVRRGLFNLPNVSLVDNPDNADYIFHSYVPHYNGQKSSEIISKYDPSKLVIIDWTDEPEYILYDKYYAYFKRSWVFPHKDGRSNIVKSKYSVNRPINMFPFWYGIMPEFSYKSDLEKVIDVGCYLRDTCQNRRWVINTVWNICQKLKSQGYICHIGPVSNETRSIKEKTYFDDKYLSFLQKTKIVVTCNPTDWEGDSRLWEAIANKCLVLVDKLYVPYNKPLSNVVQYNIGDSNELEEKLLYYLQNDLYRKERAQLSYDDGMKYHIEKARMKYVIKTLELMKIDEPLWKGF